MYDDSVLLRQCRLERIKGIYYVVGTIYEKSLIAMQIPQEEYVKLINIKHPFDYWLESSQIFSFLGLK